MTAPSLAPGSRWTSCGLTRWLFSEASCNATHSSYRRQNFLRNCGNAAPTVRGKVHEVRSHVRQDDTEIRELRRLLRDMVALATTPASWVGRELPQIADGVADILLHTLRADAVYVSLGSGTPTEGIRLAAHPGFNAEVQRLRAEHGSNALFLETASLPNWPSQLKVAIHPIGLSIEDGFVAVGCSRPAFPSEAESLLLSVAANQTAVAMQTARLRTKAEFERHRVEELLAQAPAAIGLVTGPEHRWTYVNENYVRLTGRTSTADFLGKTMRESLPELETQVFGELLDEVYRSGQPYFGREMKATLNRSAVGLPDESYWDFVYQPVRGAEGQAEGILIHAVEITDKVLARRAIEQSEERFRAIVETTPECVKVVAPDGTLLHMNSAGLTMVGADCAAMVIGKNIYDVIAPEDRGRFREFNERICNGERGPLEFDIIGLKGARRHMETHAAPLRNADGSTVQLAVTLDITERKQAEQALRESEQRFRVITDATPVMVWMSGTDKLCHYFNKSWLEFVGRTLEQEQGNGWAENVHPDDFDRCSQIYVSAFDARRPFEMEYRIRHHSGQYRWILDHGVPRYAPDGTFEGYVGGCLDVHDQKEAAEKIRIAAEALRDSEERYRAVAETASDAIVSIDDNSTILFANSATRDVFGYAADELIGKNLTKLMPDYLRRVHEAGLQRYVSTGHRHLNWDATELPGLHKDGHEIPLEVSFGEYTKGGKHYFTGFARDISERKRAEEALRQSEQEFRGLANSMPQLVWMAKPDGWIFWYNQRWYEYTGTKPEQMEGWGWQSVHDPAVLPSVMDRWQSSIVTGEPFEMTFPIRGADGEFRPFLTRVTPICDTRGSITRWFGTNTDISIEVRAREELRKNQEQLRTALLASQRLAAIVESSDDAIIGKDLDGIITTWNPCAERMFGYTADEMVGQSILKIIPPELREDEQRILATIARGERVEHFETVRLTKSGERIDVSLMVSPVRDETGRIVGAAKIARDITQRKKAEQALRTAERLASVGRFAATVAHEINNPLEAVTNLLYLARQRAVRQDVREFLANAEEELDRVSHLTKQALGFYRETKDARPMKVAPAVHSILSVLRSRMRNKSIGIHPEIKQDPEIIAVPGEIRQLLANLLSNSIDAVDAGGMIRIRVSAATEGHGKGRSGVRLTIADSGSGIPASACSRLFEPFFTTKKDVGTGLGLWVCKSIVEKHGGTIRVKSNNTPGKSGTVFSVFLPLDPQQAISEETLRQTA